MAATRTSVSPPARVVVTPEPTDEEMAAILAAYPALWPAPAAAVVDATPTWRFSGRRWVSGNFAR